jgi:hypothetical protein
MCCAIVVAGFLVSTDLIDQGLDLCAETDASGNFTLLNQQVFTRCAHIAAFFCDNSA